MILEAELSKELLSAGGVRAQARETGHGIQDCHKCPAMVVVAEGSFLMGSPSGEEGRHDETGPVRRVTIANAFAVGRFEISRRAVRAIRGRGGPLRGDCVLRVRRWRVVGAYGLELAQSGVNAGRQPSGSLRKLEGCALPHELGFTEDREALPAVE